MAITMPPLAVPSSLVSTMPVTSTTSANTFAWVRPFWPVVASRTSRTSSTSACFSMTRLILPSSSMRLALFCRRPAVSTSTTSTPSAMPCSTASKATDAGSAPSFSERTVSTPTRAPHVASCSAAAARKVSAAPSTTVRSSATSTRASLPTVVVLPTPLTPTTMVTAGRSPLRVAARRRSIEGSTIATSSSRSRVRTCSGSRVPSTVTRALRRSTSSRVGSVPRSAISSVSSISSHTSSSMRSWDSSASRPLPKTLLDLSRRARRRARREPAASGRSYSGFAGAVSASSTTAGSGSATTGGASSTSGRSRTAVEPDGAACRGLGRGSSASRTSWYDPFGGAGRRSSRPTSTPPSSRAATTETMSTISTGPVCHTGRRPPRAAHPAPCEDGGHAVVVRPLLAGPPAP